MLSKHTCPFVLFPFVVAFAVLTLPMGNTTNGLFHVYCICPSAIVPPKNLGSLSTKVGRLHFYAMAPAYPCIAIPFLAFSLYRMYPFDPVFSHYLFVFLFPCSCF